MPAKRGGSAGAMEPPTEQPSEHWMALREHTRQEALLKRAAESFASLEEKRERKLTVVSSSQIV